MEKLIVDAFSFLRGKKIVKYPKKGTGTGCPEAQNELTATERQVETREAKGLIGTPILK